LLVPRPGRQIGGEVFQEPVGHRVEQGLLAREVPVKGSGLHAEAGGELAHRQRVQPFGVEQGYRHVHHALAAQPDRRWEEAEPYRPGDAGLRLRS
jgi:hypothetical protein